MNLLERLVNVFTPLAERRTTRDALDYLQPKLGVRDAPFPEVKRGPLTGYLAPYELGGVVAAPRITYAPGTDLSAYGEEVGHYLHSLANPGLFRASLAAPPPMTYDEALDNIILRNWIECVGRYGGMLYARHAGAQYPSSKDIIRARKRFYKGLRRPKLKLLADVLDAALLLERWNDMTHVVGYRAADELIARDPGGASLPELARLSPSDARAHAGSLRSWRRYWDVLKDAWAGDAFRTLRLFERSPRPGAR